ncbi:LuxR family transcriptional regulator [Kiloniella litopenaei]|uniref:LuxR family transcriptional regulator n=1 Tax=Kiloniella litopenaei TaxID=1549748 RepID=A0A0M2R5T9_9PROT|nr:TatD family hydrolase [Kiloniella litopenaei]KKJ75355.1 LuxR family transcriptional regulator [Kiloniella litopenaei]
MIVDSHCHLDYFLKDGDLEDALTRARDVGIGCMVTIGTKLSTFDTVLGIAKANDDIYCTVGIHPHEAGTEGLSSPDVLIEKARDPKVIGLGESGLDYYYDHAPRERQQESFRAHIEAARETGLPLVVHTRDADDDTVAIMRDEFNKGAYPALIHCFTAGPELAKASLDMGFYISLSGIITYKSAEDIRTTISDAPLDRLLIETDSPYLAPVPMRGKKNEPSFVRHTAEALANVKKVSLQEIHTATTDNFYRLFTKAQRPTAA